MMLQAVRALETELVHFTQEIIRIPSLTGQEGPLAQAVLRKLKEIGVDEAFVDGAGNVVGLLRGEGDGPNVLLTGHLDVVPAGRVENWGGYDPFGGEIDQEGNIHGRGAADLKGGLAVQLYTMTLLQRLKDRGVSLPGNLIFAQVVHEEAAEMLGMAYLCEETLPAKGLTLDVVLVCEPTSLRMVLGQRGKLELVVTTRGRTAHSSTPWAGVNALQKMLPVLDRIFNELGPSLPSHPELGRGSATVTNLVCRPGALSITPDECEISVDYRYVPGQSVAGVLADFRRMFQQIRLRDPQFEADVRVRSVVERSYTGYKREVQKHHPLWILDEEHPVVRKVLRALRRVGQDPEVGYWLFGTDGGLTGGLMGIPTIGYSAAEERYAHTPEEKVNIEQLMQSLEGYYSIVCELFGIEEG